MGLFKKLAAFTPVIGSYMQASSSAKATKRNMQFEAAIAGMKAQVADFNANQIEATAQSNVALVTAVSGINTRVIRGVADLNTSIISATTDFNVGVIGATTGFNVRSAEGAADIIEARGDMQAKAFEANAELSEVNAQITLEQGNQAERNSRAGYAQLKSTQRAQLAASGVALDEGSALRVQADTDYLADVDADTIQTNAIRQAMGYRIEGANQRMQSAMASLDAKSQSAAKRMEAAAARIQGRVGIANAQFEGGVRKIDTNMTASFQILQEEMNSQINARNITTQARSEAWNQRTQAFFYRAGGEQAKFGASQINPTMQGIFAAGQAAAQIAMKFI